MTIVKTYFNLIVKIKRKNQTIKIHTKIQTSVSFKINTKINSVVISSLYYQLQSI